MSSSLPKSSKTPCASGLDSGIYSHFSTNDSFCSAYSASHMGFSSASQLHNWEKMQCNAIACKWLNPTEFQKKQQKSSHSSHPQCCETQSLGQLMPWMMYKEAKGPMWIGIDLGHNCCLGTGDDQPWDLILVPGFLFHSEPTTCIRWVEGKKQRKRVLSAGTFPPFLLLQEYGLLPGCSLCPNLELNLISPLTSTGYLLWIRQN